MAWQINFEEYQHRLSTSLLYRETGKISKSLGLVYEAHLPGASVGSLCEVIETPRAGMQVGFEAEVIGFNDKKVLLMPYEEGHSVNNESLVLLKSKNSMIKSSSDLLGRVIDGLGRPIDGKGPIQFQADDVEEREMYQAPIDPLQRKVITEPLDLGVKAINGLLTCGRGQRIGIMAGSGVGKSVLLGMMARRTDADVNVIALIGERGREVREFIERDLGEEGLKRSVVIVATSDTSPLLRLRGAFLAASIAEHFRDQEKDVLFLMDSVTRLCMAQRQIGLSMGEPPATKGYTPSVFSLLPRLLERSGTSSGNGSVTGIYTVLVEGDDMDDPIGDAVRSILDGHIVLTRELAEKNHFPAIDVLQSASRVMPNVIAPEHKLAANQFKQWISQFREVEDLINLGAYVRGANPRIDEAVDVSERLEQFLKQDMIEEVNFADTLGQMVAITRQMEAKRAQANLEETQ